MVLKRAFDKFIFVILLLCVSSFIFVYNSNAISIAIDKPILRVKVAPGGSASEVVTIKNKDITSIVVKIDIQDWSLDKQRKLVLMPPGSTPYSCAGWIDISPTGVMISPGEKREITITVRVPEDAVGGYYAAIAIESIPAEVDQTGLSAQIVTRMIVLLAQETEGRSNKMGSILSFEVSKPEENRPLIARFSFGNQGNTYLSVRGTLNIIDKDGNVHGKAETKKRQGTFPGDVIEDSIEWFGSIAKGEYNVVLTLNLGEDVLPLVEQKTIVIEEDIG